MGPTLLLTVQTETTEWPVMVNWSNVTTVQPTPQTMIRLVGGEQIFVKETLGTIRLMLAELGIKGMDLPIRWGED